MILTLEPQEINHLFNQDVTTENNGGFQKLLVKLQRQFNRFDNTLYLNETDLERIPRYAFDYGNGGWENRLVQIFSRTLGNNLGRN